MSRSKPSLRAEQQAALQDMIFEMIATNILIACDYGRVQFQYGPQTDGIEKVKYFVEEMIWPAVETYFHQTHKLDFANLLPPNIPVADDAELGVAIGHKDQNGVFHRYGPKRVLGSDGKWREE